MDEVPASPLHPRHTLLAITWVYLRARVHSYVPLIAIDTHGRWEREEPAPDFLEEGLLRE